MNELTELQMYKFFKDIEWRYEDNEGQEDVIAFIEHYRVEEFYILIGSVNLFDDGGYPCIWKGGYFCFWMNEICEWFGLELENVFPRDEED